MTTLGNLDGSKAGTSPDENCDMIRPSCLEWKSAFRWMGVKPWYAESLAETLESISESDLSRALPMAFETCGLVWPESDAHRTLLHLDIALELVRRKQSVCILLGGTSGCGKSTLASLLASRLGITTVLSTDHVRQVLRNFQSPDEAPVLWTSSYHANEAISGTSQATQDLVLQGYAQQNNALFESLDSMVGRFQERRESVIIEGVHLSVDVMQRLMERRSSRRESHTHCLLLPLVLFISNETKHMERFAIRAKYMTLVPRENRYVKYFENIRCIQQHLCRAADQQKIPKIDNTNVDRSLAILHQMLLEYLYQSRCSAPHEVFVDPQAPMRRAYEKITENQLWKSKVMLERIRKKKQLQRLQQQRRRSECLVGIQPLDPSEPRTRSVSELDPIFQRNQNRNGEEDGEEDGQEDGQEDGHGKPLKEAHDMEPLQENGQSSDVYFLHHLHVDDAPCGSLDS